MQPKFLSTPSARRATTIRRCSRCQTPISIHALREEGDRSFTAFSAEKQVFLSTPSARRATISSSVLSAHLVISIHALREEGDAGKAHERTSVHDISIHALREEGDPAAVPPVRQSSISIHALREEGDRRY